MDRYIAITDIHGELSKLENVLSKIETRPDDIFVFMGDYIDRGPDSKGVVEYYGMMAPYEKIQNEGYQTYRYGYQLINARRTSIVNNMQK